MEHTNQLRELMENIKLSGAIDTKDQFQIEEVLKNIEDAVQAGIVKNRRLQNRLDEMQDDLPQEQGSVALMTLEEERKWKIVNRMVHNLTEDELTKLETFAKDQFKKPGIIYQEIF